MCRHYGVLLLYGQHLGLNHLVARKEVRVIVGHNMLDQSTTDDTVAYVQNGIRLNLHCWHTDNQFSKFVFKMGRYNQSDLEKYRNDTTVKAYVSIESHNIHDHSQECCVILGYAHGVGIKVHDVRRDGSDRTNDYKISNVRPSFPRD